MRETIFLPTLPHWQFGNDWTGSKERMRFYIKPVEIEAEDGGKHRELLAEVWHEDVCRELATVLDSQTFPCTQEGLDAVTGWLTQKYQALA